MKPMQSLGRQALRLEVAYLKAKINELETNSKNKNNRDLYSDVTNIKKGD
jgi:hypothetical protein